MSLLAVGRLWLGLYIQECSQKCRGRWCSLWVNFGSPDTKNSVIWAPEPAELSWRIWILRTHSSSGQIWICLNHTPLGVPALAGTQWEMQKTKSHQCLATLAQTPHSSWNPVTSSLFSPCCYFSKGHTVPSIRQSWDALPSVGTRVRTQQRPAAHEFLSFYLSLEPSAHLHLYLVTLCATSELEIQARRDSVDRGLV